MPKKSAPKKIYTVTIQLRIEEKVKRGSFIKIESYTGKVKKISKTPTEGFYVADVEFNVTNLIELMVMTDERVISEELH